MSHTENQDHTLLANKHDTIAWDMTPLYLGTSAIGVHLVEGSAKEYADAVTQEQEKVYSKGLRQKAIGWAAIITGSVAFIASIASHSVFRSGKTGIDSPALAITLLIVAVALTVLGIRIFSAATDTLRKSSAIQRRMRNGGIVHTTFRLHRSEGNEALARIFTDAVTPRMRDRLATVAKREGNDAVVLVLKDMFDALVADEEQRANAAIRAKTLSLRNEVGM